MKKKPDLLFISFGMIIPSLVQYSRLELVLHGPWDTIALVGNSNMKEVK